MKINHATIESVSRHVQIKGDVQKVFNAWIVSVFLNLDARDQKNVLRNMFALMRNATMNAKRKKSVLKDSIVGLELVCQF